MKDSIRKWLPYGLVLLGLFYLLPNLIRDTGSGILVLLALMPLGIVLTAAVFGIRQGFSLWFLLLTAVLFIPSLWIFYNSSAWVYLPAYAALAAVGMGVGRLCSKKRRE